MGRNLANLLKEEECWGVPPLAERWVDCTTDSRFKLILENFIYLWPFLFERISGLEGLQLPLADPLG
jgi:hypothetical protein